MARPPRIPEPSRSARRGPRPPSARGLSLASTRDLMLAVLAILSLLFIRHLPAQQQQQQQQAMVAVAPEIGGGESPGAQAPPPTARQSPVPPAHLRPNVRVNVREWARRVSDDIRLVGNRTGCASRIARMYELEGELVQFDPVRERDKILAQIEALLGQHKAAVNGIVAEAERAAQAHQFIKNLRVNYTDVHRTRNELEPLPATTSSNQDPLNDYTTNQYGGLAGGGSSGDRPSFTSISGGTPVPGPPEWQTPIRSIVMQVNPNFGDIPVNTSMSAVHLPLPIYPGLPEIMNGIAWTERLDAVFRRNLVQYMHVHHQYYGDTLGFLRTFPAHKWRVPRNEPDLFDARTRPWYIAGAATPKDVVILVDTSGSMTGLRREIARGVVFEILDTLTINDNFAVMRFSETVTPVGLPACKMRKPRLVPQLEELCGPMGGGASSMASSTARTLADHLPLGGQTTAQAAGAHHAHSTAQHHAYQQAAAAAAAAAAASHLSGEQRRELATECANWRRQWDARLGYPRDHPDVEMGRNGTSYLGDDAYRQSIANVSLDIRDAFLLPATSRNIRYLKSNFSMPTAGIANFTRALMAGFELLQAYNRTNDLGAQCNQAIMLITDGAIKSHLDVFNRYNYPGAPIRVFAYMIGREVGDIRPTKEMACRNRGYYAHVINLGEVREQVQRYLPVMARPLVLAKSHPVTWTNAYGDETYQVLTDWVLEVKRRERARLMLNEERERLGEASSGDIINLELTGLAEYDELPQVDELLRTRLICENIQDIQDEDVDASLRDELDPLGYNDTACHWSARRADLLMSVVKPVFDPRNTSVFFERYLSKNVWQEKEIQLRNAALLGVAAVDLRIDDIARGAPSYKLGPNGYSVLLGQNGFVMHHPDFRALLEDPFDKQSKILKPHFSAVDLTHAEQVYHRNESEFARRREDDKLIKLREAAVKRATGNETMYVKRSIDCRRRPHVRLQTFYYGPIRDTPYSFMLALPASYGLNRLDARLALDESSHKLLSPSPLDTWTLHPSYRYCELRAAPTERGHLNDSLKRVAHILDLKRRGEQPDIVDEDLSAISGRAAQDAPPGVRPRLAGSKAAAFACDMKLLESMLFDAKATYEPFVAAQSEESRTRRAAAHAADEENDGLCTQAAEDVRNKLAQIYGLEMAFVATRSGLTRARIFEDTRRLKKLARLFMERHDRAVDEPWYARTVDWNMRFSDDATIITVPYNAYARLIAKLRQRLTQRAPAANDTRANCDPSEDELAESGSGVGPDGGGGDGGSVEESSATSGPPPQPAGADVASQPAGGLPVASEPAASTEREPADANSQRPQQVVGGGGGGGGDLSGQQMQQDEPQRAGAAPAPDEQLADSSSVPPLSPVPATSTPTPTPTPGPPPPRVNYSQFTSFDFLDLLANSSVHVSATRSIVANRAKKQSRVPVGVTGHLYDYATFARKFLNGTSLDIRTYPLAGDEQQQQPAAAARVDICPGGECPTRCGLRNDTIDCLLVDNNGFIVVAEELPHVGRSLLDYDENLMASLVERRVFHKIQLTDYQAICARNDQMTSDQQRVAAAAAAGAMGSVPGGNITAMLLASGPSAAASSSGATQRAPASARHLALSAAQLGLELGRAALANAASALVYTASALYSALLLRSAVPEPDELFGRDSLLGQLHQWQRSVLLLADAQSAVANQSLLALLPNKTYLRPCETTVTLYETRPYDASKLHSDAPEFYETKCGCSGWYVYDAVPKTNLLVLIVNTTAACRKCDTPPPTQASSGPANQINLSGGGAEPAGRAPLGVAAGAQTSAVDANAQTNSNLSPEEQVCHMLERDQGLYVQKPSSCLAAHPDEAQIHICGAASKLSPIGAHLGLLSVIATIWVSSLG